MPTQLQPLEITGSARSPANSALGLGSSHPLRSPYYKFDYTTYGQLADGGGARSGSSSAAGDRQRKSAPRRTVERVVHERAPALATLVAGHGDGGLKQAAKDVRDRAINAAAKGKANRNGKRYSTQEINHLVPDETGVLHDPEYESFRIIQPSAQNSQYSGSVNGHADDDEHSQSASSSDTEEDEEAATARQRQAELMNGKTSLPASQLAKRPGVGSRHGTDPTSPRPSRSYRVTTASNGTSFRNTPSHPHTSGLGALVSANRSTTPSIRSQSSGSDQASRLGPRSGNGVTYLAPSITMPPAASSYQSIATIQAQAYNPYTYVPTTSTAAEAYSHSTKLPFVGSHASRRHVAFAAPMPGSRPVAHTQTQSSAASLYPASTTTAGTLGSMTEGSDVAPPIAWKSGFTPSAEHPERHRTRQHEEGAAMAIKRSFQAAKLDVSFGLLRLGNKKR